ncbi:hypothetical protein GCM10022251_68900 [Phytohabitans flavus]|uniref:Uncharacterized protein n=1 Tax=Phytohabitans flavus TaxID=1076124 RepID=A0A6F8XUQ5_9ACTN|nr:hypothetical protein [Phytohabitans flavus]BCB77574.1 hypothetical protein Pflav_039840 [Phytohabitans flavus]
MDTVDAAPSTGRVLTGVAVLFGWFAIAALAMVLWVSQRPTVVDENCVGFCFDERTGTGILALLFGVPAVLAGLIAGAVVLAYVLRGQRSPWLAGTIAGLSGLVIGSVISCCGWDVGGGMT